MNGSWSMKGSQKMMGNFGTAEVTEKGNFKVAEAPENGYDCPIPKFPSLKLKTFKACCFYRVASEGMYAPTCSHM